MTEPVKRLNRIKNIIHVRMEEMGLTTKTLARRANVPEGTTGAFRGQYVNRPRGEEAVRRLTRALELPEFVLLHMSQGYVLLDCDPMHPVYNARGKAKNLDPVRGQRPPANGKTSPSVAPVKAAPPGPRKATREIALGLQKHVGEIDDHVVGLEKEVSQLRTMVSDLTGKLNSLLADLGEA